MPCSAPGAMAGRSVISRSRVDGEGGDALTRGEATTRRQGFEAWLKEWESQDPRNGWCYKERKELRVDLRALHRRRI